MLIPKCCKTCANKNNKFCCCTLPYTCNEYVEDDTEFDNVPIRYNTHHIMHSEFSELENKIRLSERKAVCDEIRDNLTSYWDGDLKEYVYADDLEKVLKQIQGEQKCQKKS